MSVLFLRLQLVHVFTSIAEESIWERENVDDRARETDVGIQTVHESGIGSGIEESGIAGNVEVRGCESCRGTMSGDEPLLWQVRDGTDL